MLITVVIPVYNTSSYLQRCVDSIFGQDLKDVELIFIDDCSTDDSFEVLNRCLANHDLKDVKVLRNDHNLGSGETRNRGIREASGEYVIFIDSDDYVTADYFASLRERIVAECPDIVVFDYTEIYTNHQFRKKCQPAIDKQQIVANLIQRKMHNSLCNKLIKRSLFIDNSIYIAQGMSMFEDKSVCFRLFESAKVISYIPSSLYFYDRTRDCSLTNREQGRSIKDALILLDIINEYYISRKPPKVIQLAIYTNRVLMTGLLALYDDDMGPRRVYLSRVGKIPLYSFFCASTAPFHYRISALCYYYNFSFGLKVIRNVYFKLKRC